MKTKNNSWNILMLLYCCAINLVQAQDEQSRIAHQFIVQLKTNERPEALLRQYPALRVKEVLSRSLNIVLLENEDKSEIISLEKLRCAPEIKIAQYNYYVQSRVLNLPNDVRFSEMWSMKNTGQSGGKSGADIDAALAWAVSNGNITSTGDTIVVAVIEEPFDIKHEDLNFFVNHHEIPRNGIDDDGNGFIDDYYGWNVFKNNDSVFKFPSQHGTHVSGTVGARGNNAVGTTGVCWGVKILAIDGSSQTEANVVEAYDYALEMRKLYDQTNGAKGAFVVATNTSFGVDFGTPASHPIWCAMFDSLGKRGILSAGATANRNVDVDVQGDMPTSCPSPWLITVTNTTRNDQLNGSAAYGNTTIDLGAPGTSILSTTPNNSYSSITGTSMAAPHIAGGVASLFAAACPQFMNNYYTWPDSFALKIKENLLRGVDTISALQQTVSKGRFNLYKAVKNMLEYNCGNCAFSIQLKTQPVTCAGDSDGAVQVIVSPAGNYSYRWNTNDSVASLSLIKGGAYVVTVRDVAQNCSRVATAEVYDPQKIHWQNVTVTPITSLSNGNFIVNAQAGIDSLSFALNGGVFQSSNLFVTDSVGPHTLFIKNQYGCVVDSVKLMSYIAGVGEVDASPYVVFPVPASNFLQVKFNETPINVSLKLCSAEGSILRESNNTTLYVGDLPIGIYILQVNVGRGNLKPRLISVLH